MSTCKPPKLSGPTAYLGRFQKKKNLKRGHNSYDEEKRRYMDQNVTPAVVTHRPATRQSPNVDRPVDEGMLHRAPKRRKIET
jgi:hypothetical protein